MVDVNMRIWIKSLRIQVQEKLPTFDKFSGFKINTIKFKRMQTNFFFNEAFITVIVIAKALHNNIVMHYYCVNFFICGN